MLTVESYLFRAFENGLETYLPKNQPPDIANGFLASIEDPSSSFHILLLITVLLLFRQKEGENVLEILKRRKRFYGGELFQMVGLAPDYGKKESEKEHLCELINTYCFELSMENFVREGLVESYTRADLTNIFDRDRQISAKLTEKGKNKKFLYPYH